MGTGVKIWVYGADSDCEYVEYEDELISKGKSYNMRTKDAISEKAARRHIKIGIPRRPGHYQLQTRSSSKALPSASSHFYSGHHWEIGPVSSRPDSGQMDSQINPLLLEHTTRNLTIAAVDKVVDAEQRRRVKCEAREKELAMRLYTPINRELVRLIAINLDDEKKAKKSYHFLVEGEKEDVLQELLHGKNQKSADELMEEERERRVQLMHDLTDPDKCSEDKELLGILKGLSKTNKIMAEVLLELKGAAMDLEEVCQEEDHAIDDLFLELKDDFVCSFRRASLLMKFHMAEENEKRRRMAEVRALCTGKKHMHDTQTQTIKQKGLLQEELTRIFAGVIQEESQKEAKMEDESEGHRFETQEQLLHALGIRQADQACAKERVERIHEMKVEVHGRSDPMKEHTKDVLCHVQEQMLVNIFHGKKVQRQMFRQGSDQYQRGYEQDYHEAETPHDRELREARMKARRPIAVIVTEF